MSCGNRFTTYEIVENVPILVVKKDKNREVFDRSKLIKGMLTACEKRPVSIETIERAVDEIETTEQLESSLMEEPVVEEPVVEEEIIVLEEVNEYDLAEAMAEPELDLSAIEIVPDDDDQFEAAPEEPGIEVVGVVWPEKKKKNKKPIINTYLNSNPFTEWTVETVTPSQDSFCPCK